MSNRKKRKYTKRAEYWNQEPVEEEQVTPVPPKHGLVMTAVERRDYFRKQAGWPALRT